MYMTRKWPRIAVSSAGPCSNAMLAGFALLMLPLAPLGWPHDLLWTFGALNTFFFLSNLVPVTERDGDYILMDMLEMPRLRQRAFAYLRSDLWRKIWRREQFGRLDAILAGYGVLALAGIVYTIVIAARLWVTSGIALAQAVLANPLLVLEIAAPMLALGAVVYVVRYGLPRLHRAVNHVRVAENHLGRR
jgi:putative peptide zinc metalloprotease protein